MDEVRFPRDHGQKYYDTHYLFLLRLLQDAGVGTTFYDAVRNGRGFFMHVGDRRVLVDFGDHHMSADDTDRFDATFRYHYSRNNHGSLWNTFPLTPISFYNWDQYRDMEKKVRYRAIGDTILNNQIPGKASLRRRKFVQFRLTDRFGMKVDTSITSKVKFWEKARTCFVSVCVPGARNDILDRGQFQYWAFGACTISPRLDIVLPYWREPEPGTHYVACKDDYSDLIDIIESLREQRERCVRIGEQAKALFQECCTPKRVIAWIEKCLQEVS